MDEKTFEYMKERTERYKKLADVKRRLENIDEAKVVASNTWTLSISSGDKRSLLSGEIDKPYVDILCKAIDKAIDECIALVEKEMGEI